MISQPNSPPSPKYTVLMPSRWGWYVGMKSDPFQTGSVATQGEWAPDETALVLQFIQPGHTVLDVGANVGNMTMAFAAAVGEGGYVVAFEPQQFCYACLMANVALNSLVHRVDVVRAAVGDAPGTIEVPTLNPMQQIANFGGVGLLDKHTTPTQQVPVVTIDSLELRACHFIKADVEGMEPMVFRGARETIMKFRPTIWTECLADRNTRDDLVAIFSDCKYRTWRVITNLYSEQNTRLCRHNMFTVMGEGNMQDHNVLALPEELRPPWWTDQLQPL